MATKVIGKVSVKVFPDTKHFKEQLEQALRDFENGKGIRADKHKVKIETVVDERALRSSAVTALRNLNRELASDDKTKLKFRTDVDPVGMKGAVTSARRQLQSMAEEYSKKHPIRFKGIASPLVLDVNLDPEAKKKVERQLHEWIKDVSPLTVFVRPELAFGAAGLTRTRLDVLTRPRSVLITPHLNNLAAGRVAATLAALSGGRAAWDMGADVWELVKELDKAAPKIAAVSNGVMNLAAWALTATSNTLSLGASLASIAPAALTLPGLFGGMAIGLGASAAALKDFNKELPQVKRQLSEMQDEISASFWTEARNPMARFFNELMPQFTDNLGRTGTALGGFFGDLSTSFVGVFDGQIKGMFDDLNESIDIASRYTDNFASVIATLGRVGAASLPDLSRWFGVTMADFDKWLTKAEKDGSLDQWIDNGIEGLKDLGVVVRETSSTFAGLARAAERAGGSTLDSLAETMTNISDTVNSKKFQGAMTKTFRAAHTAMDEVANGAGQELEDLLYSLSDLFSTVMPTAGRTAGKALGAIFDALDQPQVMNSVIRAFENIEEAVDTLAPAMPELARAMGAVLEVATELAHSVAKVVSPAIENLGPKVEEIADIIGPLANVLGNTLAPAVEGISKAVAAVPAPILLAAAAMLALKKESGHLALAQRKVASTFTSVGGYFKQTRTDLRNLSAEHKRVTNATLQTRDGYKQLMFSNPNGFLLTQAKGLGTVTRQTNALGKANTKLKYLMSGTTQSAQRLRGQLKQVGTGVGLGAVALASMSDGFALSNTAMMAMTGSLVGPWGAAIGGVAGVFMDIGAATKSSTDALNAYNESLRANDITKLTGGFMELRKSTQAAVADMGDVTGLMDGVGDGMSAISDKWGDGLDEMLKKNKEAEGQLTNLTGVLSGVALANNDFIRSFREGNQNYAFGNLEDLERIATAVQPHLEELGYTMESLAAMKPGSPEMVKAIEDINAALAHSNTNIGRAEALGEVIKSLGGDVEGTAEAANKLNSAFAALLNPGMKAAEAADAYRAGLRNLKDQVSDSSRNLVDNTDAADQNRAALRGLVGQLTDYLSTRDVDGDQLALMFATEYEQMVKTARQLGMNEEAVRSYLGQLGLTPESVGTVVDVVGVEKEHRRIQRLNAAMDFLPEKLQTDIATAGYPVTRRQLKDLAAEYDKTPRMVEVKIRALIREAAEDIEATNRQMDNLGGKKAEPVVEVKDKATKGMNDIDAKLDNFGRKVAEPTLGIRDEATVKLNAITQKVNDLDNRNVNINVTTNYRTTGSPSRPGGRPNAVSERTLIPTGTLAQTERAVSRMGDRIRASFDRLTKTMRDNLVKQSDTWLQQVQGKTVSVNNAITQAISQAENKVNNAQRKLDGARTAEGKKQAKRELDKAKAALKGINNLKKGWREQNREITKAVHKYEELNTELLSAVATLESVNQQITAFKESLKDSYDNWASILEAPMSTFSSMEKHLERQIKDLRSFKEGLTALTGMGLNQTIVDQLASAGPEALDFIKSILKEGQTGVDRLNQLWGDVDRLGGKTAEIVGDYVFADELQIAQDAVDGLLAALKDLKGPIDKATNALLGSIAKSAKANRKKITKDLDAIIKKYRDLIKTVNNATLTNTPGLTGRVTTATTASTVNNDNRTYNINIAANGQQGNDLFAAAQQVKAVIATT